MQAPNQTVRGESRNLSQMLSQKLKTVDHNPFRRCYRDLKYFIQDNWQRAWVMALWIGVMAVLFTWKYVQYKNRAAFEVMGHCVCLAKGAAETLKLNMALILLPVCRNTITWLRNKTRLGVAVPFDDNLNFHKVSLDLMHLSKYCDMFSACLVMFFVMDTLESYNLCQELSHWTDHTATKAQNLYVKLVAETL